MLIILIIVSTVVSARVLVMIGASPSDFPRMYDFVIVCVRARVTCM